MTFVKHRYYKYSNKCRSKFKIILYKKIEHSALKIFGGILLISVWNGNLEQAKRVTFGSQVKTKDK